MAVRRRQNELRSPCDRGSEDRNAVDTRAARPSSGLGGAFRHTPNREGDLALAGTRALWSARGFGNSEYLTMWFGSTLAGSGHALFYGYRDSLSGGVEYRGMAGSGRPRTPPSTGRTHRQTVPTSPAQRRRRALSLFPRRPRCVDGGGTIVPIPGSKVGDAVAAYGTTAAVSYGRRITVINSRTGATVGSAIATQRVSALALGPSIVAALTGSAIEIFNWRTHRAVRRTIVRPTPTQISLSDSTVVWARGADAGEDCPATHRCGIWALNIVDGRLYAVVRTNLFPFDASISGRRIIWGESATAKDGFGGLRVVRSTYACCDYRRLRPCAFSGTQRTIVASSRLPSLLGRWTAWDGLGRGLNSRPVVPLRGRPAASRLARP